MPSNLTTLDYYYDLAGRLTSSTDANGFTVGYGYDANGNVTSITYPGDRTVNYAYDVLNRLTTVTTWLNQTATYSYDAAGRLTQRTNFNGSVAVYSYDNANRLTSLVNHTSSGTVLSSHSFTLDGNGNRTQEVRDEPLPPSNLIPGDTALAYNATRNRLLTAGDDTFAHDTEGQLTDKSGTAYDFDYAHRLIAVGSTTFQYDGAGNRLRATRNGVTTKYVYDAAGNLIAEADQNNAITRYYIHGAGLLGFIEGNTTYSYHYDAIGSTLAITDQSQEIVNAYAYTPYGKLVNEQQTKAQPFKYVGQLGVMTEQNDLYYMRARYYEASVGRFISEDPIGFEGGLNLYAYVGGNPVMAVDPSGTMGSGVGSLQPRNPSQDRLDLLNLATGGAELAAGTGILAGCVGTGVLGCVAVGSGALLLGANDLSSVFADQSLVQWGAQKLGLNQTGGQLTLWRIFLVLAVS